MADSDTTNNNVRSGSTDSGESWSIFVFQVANGDLEPFSVQNLAEMAAVPNYDNLNFIVLADRHPYDSNEPIVNLENWDSSRYVRGTKGNI